MEIKFTIPLEPKTKKNSGQILVNKRTGKPFVSPSKTFKEYQDQCGYFVPKGMGITQPINIKALYYMKTRRKVDKTNLESALLDILVHYGVIEDDNSTIVVATDGSRVYYDKENPRTEVTITAIKE